MILFTTRVSVSFRVETTVDYGRSRSISLQLSLHCFNARKCLYGNYLANMLCERQRRGKCAKYSVQKNNCIDDSEKIVDNFDETDATL